MAIFHGTTGDDDLIGTTLGDEFGLGKGGTDKAFGDAGWDVFHMGAELDAADEIRGGAGRDTVMLKGDYSAGLTLGPHTIINVERLYLNAGFSYNLTVHDGMVNAGETFSVNAGVLAAGQTLAFDGLAETDGAFKVLGGAGDDSISGGAQDDRLLGNDGEDSLRMDAGGNDRAFGGAGNDAFAFGAAFTAQDRVFGGAGTVDTVGLSGDYTGVNALVANATTMLGIERIFLFSGSSFDITLHDTSVAAGITFNVDGFALGAGDGLTFDGSQETDGTYFVQGGAGNDDITTGAMGDEIFAGAGDDVLNGGGGGDLIELAENLTAADAIDGDTGTDTVELNGDYTGANAVVFADTTMVAVETLSLFDGFSYDLTFADGTVDSFTNLTLTVNAGLTAAFSATIDGSAEADSNYIMNGGAGGDDFIGGAFADELNGNDGADTLTGGGGLDDLTGGAGADTFRYTAVSQSTSTSHDHVTDFDAASDFFDTTIGVTSILTASGSISSATFDADMGLAIDDSLGATGAAVVTATGGDLIGHTYLVVNGNGDGFYLGGVDYVIDITGLTGTITTGNFI